MEFIANLIGMTEAEFKDFYLSRLNFAIRAGFSEDEARDLVQQTLRKQLGL